MRRAIDFFEQDLAVAREIGDRQGETITSWNLGLAYEQLGDIASAIEAMQRHVDYEREIGHPDAVPHAAMVEALRQRLQGGARGPLSFLRRWLRRRHGP
jgi:hypothetical protein